VDQCRAYDTLKDLSQEHEVVINTTLIGFDDQVEILPGYNNVPVHIVEPVDRSHIFARGGTEMWQAIGETLSLPISNDEPVFLAILTDGGSSVSRDFPQSKIKNMLKDRPNWTVAMIASNQSAIDVAKEIDVTENNAMTYSSDVQGTRSAFHQLSRALRRYVAATVNGNTLEYLFLTKDKSLMKVGDYACTVNMPEAEKIEDGDLPSYSPVPAFVVDEYPACPDTWMPGSKTAASYFIPVRNGHGMWLDFNDSVTAKRDIAVVVSVQGINPVTGQKTAALGLEQYKNKCPKHDVEFKNDRFCSICGYKWPAQNYISSAATPTGKLWIDGFLTPEGKVRQYLFTEDEKKGVAGNILGLYQKQQVYAIGIAFYRAKEDKPLPPPTISYARDFFGRQAIGNCSWYSDASGFSGVSGFSGTSGISGYSGYPGIAGPPGYSDASGFSGVSGFSGYSGYLGTIGSSGYSGISGCSGYSGSGFSGYSKDAILSINCAFDSDVRRVVDFDAIRASLSPKNYEIGAGIKLDQRIYEDTNPLNYYEDEPIGIIYVSYSDEETVSKILDAGKREEVETGFLSGIELAE
jgi:hypothetical protein